MTLSRKEVPELQPFSPLSHSETVMATGCTVRVAVAGSIPCAHPATAIVLPSPRKSAMFLAGFGLLGLISCPLERKLERIDSTVGCGRNYVRQSCIDADVAYRNSSAWVQEPLLPIRTSGEIEFVDFSIAAAHVSLR